MIAPDPRRVALAPALGLAAGLIDPVFAAREAERPWPERVMRFFPDAAKAVAGDGGRR